MPGYPAAVDCDHDPDGEGLSAGTPDQGTWVRLCHRVDPWNDGSIDVCAQIAAPGLTATLHGVTLSVMGGTDLVPFLDGLATDFTGWDGTRTWTTLDGDLRIDAVFGAGGHVSLIWTLTPWRDRDGTWSASTTVVVEAGEQLSRLAADAHGFLS